MGTIGKSGDTGQSPTDRWTPPGRAQTLVSLSREECLRFLTAARIGRVVFVAGGAPVALPVNFTVDGDGLVFVAARDTVLDAVGDGTDAGFQVDHFERLYQLGWSVLVAGPAREVTEFADLHRVRALPLQPWAPGERDRFIRIEFTRVTGRRIVDSPP